ncbi:hypothetical protein MIN45_P0418 [Methylomarinovum tepidoasis]|uniref:EfeO-type cupredoxin-like domain-containing protein n=1 Tax=Methylomarinovum tepidoasis TaxID=2840183 RepID=A0AAU9CBI1_9GAMM|nr:cupredoxin domain-containing protein [Methylomarinovum sp. IN45]BCX88051.1 hypothetical protein MIN45_P0418 [Methylomarinovum sp. IN45]
MKLPTTLLSLLMLLSTPMILAQPAIRIELGDFRFHPDEIRVPPGVPIALELVNTDTITPHDFILEAPEAAINLRVDVPPGKTVKATFTSPSTPGIYPFYCSKRFLFFKSHRARGMEGRLIVQPRSEQLRQ